MFKGSQSINYIDVKKLLPLVNQEALFFKYTGIYPTIDKYYKSLFRQDSIPGCSFHWHSGILYFKDNATYNGRLYFNVIDCICILTGCSYKDAIKAVIDNSDKNVTTEFIKESQKDKKVKPEIRFKYKNWPKDNYFKLLPEQLNNEYVYLIEDYWINRNGIWECNPIHNPKRTLSVAYYFPHNNNVKLYFPHESNFRFFTNCDDNDIYGMYDLEYFKKDQPLIVTKSQKDRLMFKYFLDTNTLAVQSETSIHWPENIVEKLQEFSDIKVIFDSDATGKLYGKKLSDLLKASQYEILNYKDAYDSFINTNKIQFTKL